MLAASGRLRVDWTIGPPDFDGARNLGKKFRCRIVFKAVRACPLLTRERKAGRTDLLYDMQCTRRANLLIRWRVEKNIGAAVTGPCGGAGGLGVQA